MLSREFNFSNPLRYCEHRETVIDFVQLAGDQINGKTRMKMAGLRFCLFDGDNHDEDIPPLVDNLFLHESLQYILN